LNFSSSARFELGYMENWMYLAFRRKQQFESDRSHGSGNLEWSIVAFGEFPEALTCYGSLSVGAKLHINVITDLEGMRQTMLICELLHSSLSFEQFVLEEL
jgi:hypothetical protein